MRYKFWVTSSRMTDISETVELDDGFTEAEIKEQVEYWCEKVFPMFHYTDASVRYGYEELPQPPAPDA